MRWTMRVFGTLNILLTVFSLYYFAWGIEIHLGRWPGNPNSLEWAVFFTLSSLSTSLVIYLAFLGVRLIRGDYKALWKVCCVFVSEIAICFVDFVISWIAKPTWIRKDVDWFWGIALFPLDPQVLFGYAFFGTGAAIVLILVARRSSRTLENYPS